MPTAKEQVFAQRGLQVTALKEQEKWQVAELWFKGYTVKVLADTFKHPPSVILKTIHELREDILEWHRDSLLALAAERIEGFRHIQREAWDAKDAYPVQANQLLSTILRAEENIARIQGVLSDKHQHIADIVHHVKLYDFTDKFPQIGSTDLPARVMPEASSHNRLAGNQDVIELEAEEVVVVDGEFYEGEAVQVPLEALD
ncbi:MAG: hypothetical protein KJ587_19880 [Alphaproteobacteria bacterium]|nr:hypothetical protein [Alphaproteobacteria bacterium]